MHDSNMGRLPWVLLAALAVFIGFAGYYLFPSDQTSIVQHPQVGHALLGGVLLVHLLRIPKAQQTLAVQQFWFCCRSAFFIWVFTKIAIVLSASQLWPIAQYFADFGYFAFYLVTLLSLRFYSASKSDARENIKQYMDVFFISVLFVYLVVVPAQQGSNEFANHSSAFLFYIILDAYLALQFYKQAVRDTDLAWRRRFNTLALTFLLFFCLDSFEFLLKMQVFSLDAAHIWELVWFLPYFTFAWAFRFPIPSAKAEAAALPLPNVTPALLPIMLLPLLHVVGFSAGLFAAASQPVRAVIVVIWCFAFWAADWYLRKHRVARPNKELLVSAHNEPIQPQVNSAEIDFFPFAFFQLDRLGHIVVCNQAAERLFGYNNSQLQHKFFSVLLDKDEPLEQLLRFTESSFSKSGLVTSKVHEAVFHDSSDNKLSCYLAFSTLPNNGLAVAVVDVSGLKASEAQAQALQEKFLANMTHEFRTPLTIILGALEQSLGQMVEPGLKTQLLSAQKNGHYILKLVDQLLVLSKITSAPKLEKITQSVSDTIIATCEPFAALCLQKDIRFRYNATNNLYADIHEDSLQQILSNLLSNAYKYTGNQGEIELSACVANEQIEIRIRDSGCGMTGAESEQLFARYRRSEGAKRGAAFGVGIGLSLVSELVQAHGWDIRVESTPGKGSEFIITMPVATSAPSDQAFAKAVSFDAEAVQVPGQSSSQALAAQDSSAASNEDMQRLLIIEDNLDMQSYLQHLLAAEYNVEIVGTGNDGIAAAKASVPDIIICDLMLPDITGFDVVDRVKSDMVTSHIPILMLTAKNDQQSKLTGLSKKVDDYLTKPFNHQELSIRLNNLLQLRKDLQVHLQAKITQERQNQLREGALPEQQASEQAATNQLEAQFVEKIQVLTDKYYTDENFSLSQFASQMAMSERQLQRKLNAAMGMSPNEFLRAYRLQKAQSLLKQSIPVGIVAERVGFSSQAYFTKCFKEAYACTPTDYSKRH